MSPTTPDVRYQYRFPQRPHLLLPDGTSRPIEAMEVGDAEKM